MPDFPLDFDVILGDAFQLGHGLHQQFLHDLLGNDASFEQVDGTGLALLGPLGVVDEFVGSLREMLGLQSQGGVLWHAWSRLSRGE